MKEKTQLIQCESLLKAPPFAKIILENTSKKRIEAVLFDSKIILSPKIKCKVEIGISGENYKQEYDDFFDSINYESLIINNITSTEDDQIKIFIKDTLMGKKQVLLDSTMALTERTQWIIDLSPLQKFIIKFDIQGREVKPRNYSSTQY